MWNMKDQRTIKIMLFVLVDAHSEWSEVFAMSSTMSGRTITKLSETFARFRLLEQLVLDNGPQFVSNLRV